MGSGSTAIGGPYNYFAIEFGINCRCGNDYGFTPTTSGAQCTTVAKGTTNEAGGGANAVSVYKRKVSSVRQLSTCSLLKCSALCKLFLQSRQGGYRVSMTALRPSHSITHGGITLGHLEHKHHDILGHYNDFDHHTHRSNNHDHNSNILNEYDNNQATSASEQRLRWELRLARYRLVSTPPLQLTSHT